ncbi:MAG: CDP-alcohol phosphatidyltransferase family protein [Hyphomonadaceae bacterium]
MKWLPNAVSISRLALAPLIGYLICIGLAKGVANRELEWAFGLFVVSALTDWLDGFLARKLDAKSELGGKLDLWGDKILVGITLLALWAGWIIENNPQGDFIAGALGDPIGVAAGLFFLLAIPVRDSLVTRLRAQASLKGISLSPTFAAKSKTAVIMGGMGVLLAGLATGLSELGYAGFAILVLGALMSIWTGLSYFRAARGAGSTEA